LLTSSSIKTARSTRSF